MSEQHLQQLLKTLNDSKQSEIGQSTQALEISFAWVLETVKQARMKNRGQLLLALQNLSKVLTRCVDGISGLAPVLDEGRAGEKLDQEISLSTKKINSLSHDIRITEKKLGKLHQLENRYQQLESEKDKLEKRLKWIEEHSGFDEAALDELRGQVKQIELNKKWLGEIEKIEDKINTEAPELFVLSANMLNHLETHSREQLTQLKKKYQAIEEQLKMWSEKHVKQTAAYELALAELQTSQARYEFAEKSLEQVNEVLKKYTQANQHISEALGNTEAYSVQAVLDQIERLLGEVDTSLNFAITANAEAKQITQIGL
jgi:DNA repair exonuclease SbcCD ATPase subunit